MDKGAHFYNCDFQVHTPRDHQWSWAGNSPLGNGGCVLDDDRKAYAKSLIEACRSKGLNAIAITDHHDMVFFQYIKEAAQSEIDESGHQVSPEDQIVVFPGMEVTINPCQFLLIFDADFPVSDFRQIYTKLDLNPSQESESKTANVEQLPNINTIDGIKDALDGLTSLKGTYIIFPNLGNNEHHSLLKGRHHLAYKKMHAVGGYLDGKFTNLSEGKKDIIQGIIPQYGNRKLAYFQTSDNRTADHSKLGEHTSWVKWSKPTAEALRQACLAQESRIFDQQPELPSVSINRVFVSDSTFLGSSDLELNDQYNAFIGGRGTGKSTMLEYIRWCLCDYSIEDETDEASKIYKLVKKTLEPKDGIVIVEMTMSNTVFRVERSSKDGFVRLFIDGQEQEVTRDEIRKLLPIQAYSQKQISELSSKAIELSRFVQTPIQKELVSLDIEIDNLRVKVENAYLSQIKLKKIDNQIIHNGREAQSLGIRLENIKKEFVGLTEESKFLLAKKPDYDAASIFIKSLLERVNNITNHLRETVEWMNSHTELEVPENPFSELGPDFLIDAHKQFLVMISEAIKTISNAITLIEAKRAKIEETKFKQFNVTGLEFQKEHDKAFNQFSSNAKVLEQTNQLSESIKSINETLSSLNLQQQQVRKEADNYSGFKNEWLAKINERDDVLKNQCDSLTNQSGEVIDASLLHTEYVYLLCDELSEILRGTYIREDRLNSLKKWMIEVGGKDVIMNVLSELRLISLFDPEINAEDHFPDTPNLIEAGFEQANLLSIAGHLDTGAWLQISLIPMKGNPVFKFKLNNEKAILFEDASAGQQATAILKILLRQDGPPLIIDQPEDDLDNAVIQEIVTHVWNAKNKRQLIFASHNPNLVVHGDAELVVCFGNKADDDKSKGCIKEEGAIDITAVREEIQSIMEGGEAAFTLRRKKYGF